MMRRLLSRFRRDESGATAIEYGLILSLMFLVILGALNAFGATGSGIFNGAMDMLRSAMGG
ncbi:MAG: Flp family type IVb pilin [Brevundimonas sp.]|uniref:Flp family type IVb pilin n=1 Tax=Brevundimonas sp. TaxID=1871086 RepID=UPI0027358F0D|nr:Flp family type IVb pilin [Brevundimonas sp.]MDP3657451.1 Flp family type IVb pilin [Brevundimonas sp.]